jgi:hypothetical protein
MNALIFHHTKAHQKKTPRFRSVFKSLNRDYFLINLMFEVPFEVIVCTK